MDFLYPHLLSLQEAQQFDSELGPEKTLLCLPYQATRYCKLLWISKHINKKTVNRMQKNLGNNTKSSCKQQS